MKRSAEQKGTEQQKKLKPMDHTALLETVLFGDLFRVWDIEKLDSDRATFAAMMRCAGLKCALVANPRAAVSVYTHPSKTVDQTPIEERTVRNQLPWLMLGLHPHQADFENSFQTLKERYVTYRLALRLLKACCPAKHPAAVKALTNLRDCSEDPNCQTRQWDHASREAALDVVCSDMNALKDTLRHDVSFTTVRNNTLPNALLDRFLELTKTHIHDIVLNDPADPLFQRMNVSFYDPECDYSKPRPFAFKPGFRALLGTGGVDHLIDLFTNTFWEQLTFTGYMPSPELKQSTTGPLKRWSRSGVVSRGGIMALAANFTPTQPFAMYLHGAAGAGKSSFVRNFLPSLNLAINQYFDPQLEVRFVKHNLNKPLHELKHELQLRPNNNDLSVMSIIQGRRMTFGQTKRGLVVIALEEVPMTDTTFREASSDETGTMDQSAILSHLCTRFKGIDGDATLLPMFTSNYPLSHESRAAFQTLQMLNDIVDLEVHGIEGEPRECFARNLLCQLIRKQTPRLEAGAELEAVLKPGVELGTGDTRPIVLQLRIAALYAARLITESPSSTEAVRVVVEQTAALPKTAMSVSVQIGSEVRSTELEGCDHTTLFYPPQASSAFLDQRASVFQATVEERFPEVARKLSHVVDYYFCGALAPAVVVTRDNQALTEMIASTLDEGQGWCVGVRGVNPEACKMTRSLYDSRDTPNLRDDIITAAKAGDGNVVIEITAPTKEAQLLIRELVEDSPSMTAFSTARSALYKNGLFFVVNVTGPLTPELASRASLVL